MRTGHAFRTLILPREPLTSIIHYELHDDVVELYNQASLTSLIGP